MLSKEQVERLNSELSALQQELQEVKAQGEEERRTLEIRAVRAEADAALAADELAEAREAQVSFREHQCTPLVPVGSDTYDQVVTIRCLLIDGRWARLVEARLHQHYEDVADETLWYVRKTAGLWQQMVSSHSRDEDRLARQSSEANRLDEELDKLQEQNQDLFQSLQGTQQELLVVLSETRRLQKREADFEDDIDRMQERNAQLVGHTNQKQKIRHLMTVKEENCSLRQELKRCKQRGALLEAKLRSATFFDALSGNDLADVRSRTPGRKPAIQEPRTPGRSAVPLPRTPSKKLIDSRADILAGIEDDRPEALRHDRQEIVRHARAHRRASERASTEYLHLATLVEQVLLLHDVRTSSTSVSASGTCPPSPARSDAGSDSATPAALLSRVRELASRLTSSTLRTEAVRGDGQTEAETQKAEARGVD